MARMTKAQLVDENIALRHNISLLEAKVAEYATQLLRAKGSANCTVGQVLAIDRRRAPAQPGGEVVVATYTKRDGSRWDKVRIGHNLFVHRPAN